MEKERKEYIDALWKNTLYGKWVLAAAKGRADEADRIAEEIMKEYPFTLGNAAAVVREEIAKTLEYPGEAEEYLKALDKEDNNLVDFIISNCSMFDNL